MDELSQMIKEITDGTKEELKTMLPVIDLSPDISDEKIKQAILDMKPAGWQKLFTKFGQKQVIDSVSTFSQRRQF